MFKYTFAGSRGERFAALPDGAVDGLEVGLENPDRLRIEPAASRVERLLQIRDRLIERGVAEVRRPDGGRHLAKDGGEVGPRASEPCEPDQPARRDHQREACRDQLRHGEGEPPSGKRRAEHLRRRNPCLDAGPEILRRRRVRQRPGACDDSGERLKVGAAFPALRQVRLDLGPPGGVELVVEIFGEPFVQNVMRRHARVLRAQRRCFRSIMRARCSCAFDVPEEIPSSAAISVCL